MNKKGRADANRTFAAERAQREAKKAKKAKFKVNEPNFERELARTVNAMKKG